MNGYDFDNTILKGNSWRRFFCYCLARYPYIILLFPISAICAILYLLHIIDNRKFSAAMSLFLLLIPNKKKVVEKFWDKNQKHIKQWYLDQRQDDDFVLSASPQFLVEPMCKRLGILCIASEMDIRTGQYTGAYYYGPMKVVGYTEHFGTTPLQRYYSDSTTDAPMWKLAKEGWFVDENELTLCYQDGEVLPEMKHVKHKKYWRF